MATVRGQVTLATSSGVLEDRPTNVWHFTAVRDDTTATAITTALAAFYSAVGADMPVNITSTGHSVKFYDLADPTPRAPFAEKTFSIIPSPVGNPLPTEVALCLSFQGDKASGVPQARRRGRVYIGPLDTAALDTLGRPNSATITRFQTAAIAFLDASQAAISWDWVVYSPTDNAVVPVTNGWIDNAWDTQRRRGIVATTRTTFN